MSEFVRVVKPLAPLIPIGLAAVAIATSFLAARRHRRSREGVAWGAAWWSAACDVGLVASLLAIGILTLLPSIDAGRTVAWVPFSDSGGSVRTVERIANIILYVPLGFFAPARLRRLDSFPRVTAAAAALSIAIETLQFALALGRQTSTTDVLLNTIGAVVGYAVLRAGRTVRGRAGERPNRRATDT